MKTAIIFLATLVLSAGAMAAPVTIVVDFEDDATFSDIQDTEEQIGADLQPNSFMFDQTKIMTVTVDDSIINIDKLLKDVESDWDVDHAERSYEYTTLSGADFSVPNDPMYNDKQWNFKMIGMEGAWGVSTGEGVVVAILDTGVSEGSGTAKRVPDLKETCFVPGRNFIDRGKENDPYDGNAHGTHVAGTIAQSTNNHKGVAGMAFKACIMPVKVLSDGGSGSTAGIAEAIRWAADNGANVINMSLGGGGRSRIMEDAVAYAHDKNVFIACAAGNDSSDTIGYPAAYEGCFAVSAVAPGGEMSFYSTHGKGPNGTSLFIAAPGGDQSAKYGPEGGIFQNTIVPGDMTKSGYFPFQGTSMATPHVAGLAALMISAMGPDNYNVDTVAKIMADTAFKEMNGEKKDAYKFGAGIINAKAAVIAASQHSDSTLPEWIAIFIVGFATLVVSRKLAPKYKI